MDVLMLGPFELRRGDSVIDLGDQQQRYLLVVLLLRANRPVFTTRLAEIVWAGQPTPKTNLVPNYISRLRRAFRDAGAGEDEIAIDTTPTGYRLRIDPECIDRVRFERLCAQAADAAAGRDTDRQRELLHAALALVRGPFLEDLDSERIGGPDLDSPQDAVLDALGDLAELELARGGHRWVRDQLRPALRAAPVKQKLAGLLIRAYIANGDRPQAVDVYHRTRDALDEYGMETSVELRRLVAQAQREDRAGDLPSAPGRFVGRDAERAAIAARAAAAAEGSAVVWISGLPGVGKTGLAVQSAHALRERYPDGLLFVELDGYTLGTQPLSAGDALRVLLEQLDVPPEQIPRSTAERAATYQSRLRGTRTLVVVDNANSEQHARDLLPAAPGCLALVTSRQVAGIGVDDEIRLEPLAPGEAVELFGALVGADRTRHHPGELAQVLDRCGGVPLQIRMVAAQFRKHPRWPIEHLLGLLTEATAWSAGGEFGDAVSAAVTVSYQQLNDPQRRLFRLFGRLPGRDLTVPAAAALLGSTVPQARGLLEDLLGASLLEESTPERYLMLDSLKEFAAGTAEGAPGEEAEALDRLLDHQLTGAARAAAVLFPFDRDHQRGPERESSSAPVFPDETAAEAWLVAERDNLLAAVRDAARRERTGPAWQLPLLLWRWYYRRYYFSDWVETLELARTALRAEPGERRGLAEVLLRLANGRQMSGSLDDALESAAVALTLFGELGDPGRQAAALSAIGLIDMDRGDNLAAIEHYRAAVEKCEQVGGERMQANALSNLGHLHELQGEFALSERESSAAVELLEKHGYTDGLADSLDNRGVARRQLGRLDEAIADHRRARELAADAGDRKLEAYALNNTGSAHRDAGRFEEAVEFHERAREMADLVGDPILRIQLYNDRGATYLAAGENEKALRCCFAAVDLAAAVDDRGLRARAALGAARALHVLGRHIEAAEHWQAAESVFADLRVPEAAEIRDQRAAFTCDCA